MNEMTSTRLSRLFQMVHTAILVARDELNALDLALGDGDHGTALANAFSDAAAKLQTPSHLTPSEILAMVAQSLMNRMGGASGALYGTLFLRASTACKDKTVLTQQDFAALLRAGLEGVMQRGKAQVGDKTMIDALYPAVEAFEKGADFSDAFEKAAEASQAGAISTKTMVARYGRARFVGERAVGHIDAGAGSIAVLFAAMAASWKEFANDEA